MSRNPFAKPEAVARHLKLAVTGKPGTGKTVFGLDAKNHGMGRVAVISNEAGDVHYLNSPQWGEFDRLATQSIAELEEALDYLESNPGAYRTLVVDTVTGLYEALVEARSKEDGSVAMREWGLIKRKWKSIMARLNNLPLNIVEVVHENDLVEQTKEGGTRVVGQKLDAEKNFDRNPDVLIRLGVVDGKRVARVLKDRTGTFQAGDVVNDPHLGLWSKAIKARGAEARVSLPDEVAAQNAAAMERAPAPEPASAVDAEATPEQVALFAQLSGALAAGFRAAPHAAAWAKKHKSEIETLPEALRSQLREQFKQARIGGSETEAA